MKTAKLLLLLATFGFLGLSSIEIKAQAPFSIAGRAAVLTITNGNGPFATYGTFLFLASATDNSFGSIVLSGNGSDGDGTYSYTKQSASTGQINYTSYYPSYVTGLVSTLTFTSSTTGYFVSTYLTYTQTGTFSVYNGQAPASVKGWTFQLQVDAGASPYATYGDAQITTAASGNSYQIIGQGGVSSSSGTYVYTTYPQISPSTTSLTLNDSVLGPEYTQTLSWQTATSGAYVVRDAANGAFQVGTFEGTPPSYTVTPSTGGNGSISPNTLQTITSGGSVAFTATPNTGYVVNQWLVNGVVVQTGGAAYTVNDVTANTTVGVTFLLIPVINSPSTANGTYGSVFSGYTITASGSPTIFNATNLPSGLSIKASTGLISGTPTQTGTFNVTLSANNGTTGSAPLTLTVAKATATVSLSNLATTYNGLTKAPTATTSPSGLNVIFTYNGSTTAPNAPSSYAVVGTVSDPNYQGSTTGTLVISPVSSPQTFSQWQTFYSTSGALTTPRNDGIPNLLKYLFDINPSSPMTVSERAGLQTVDMTTTGGMNYLTLTYRQYVALTGVTINVQTSPDLQTWTTVSPPDLSQQVGTASGDPIMEVGVKLTGATKQFIRLNVTSP